MSAKLFIFDVDGVLLDLWATMKGVYEEFTSQKLSQSQWDDVIADYLRDPVPYRQFGEYFDNSDAMASLSAVHGMPELVRKLKLLDFDLMIITSVTDREDITRKRESNLSHVFGDVFDRIIYTGRGSSKAAALEEAAKGYHVSFFCDDHPKNAAAGRGIVTYPLWFANPHQRPIWEKIDREGIIEIRSAEEIFELAKKV